MCDGRQGLGEGFGEEVGGCGWGVGWQVDRREMGARQPALFVVVGVAVSRLG
jgi:hypothetical protein